MTEAQTISSSSPKDSADIAPLRKQLATGSPKQQGQAIATLATLEDEGLEVLQDFLSDHQDQPITWVMGKAYQVLSRDQRAVVQGFLLGEFPEGLVPLASDRQVDYDPLQTLLVEEKYLDADILTLQLLCELAGPQALRRKWLYFTEVKGLPVTDLHTIDRLWRIYSEGKFGFSIQRQLWLSSGKDYNQLWEKIDWREGNNWTRYPKAFTWSTNAPIGHLPTSNQLRGSQMINALFNHPAWQTPDPYSEGMP